MIVVLILIAVFPLAGQEVNIAQGRQVTASSIYNAGLAAEKAVDGNPGTRWSSKYSDPQWIRVDLGASYNVTRIVLSWEASSAKGYRVEVSNDDTSWTVIAQRTNLAAGKRVDDLKRLSGTGRYVRVYCSARTSQFGYSLWELKIYGAPASASAGRKSGLLVGIGCGMSIPVGPSADLLNLGVSASLDFGWQFGLGPGRLKLGFESGTLWESTKSNALVYAPYNSFFIPLAAFVGYDFLIAGGFQLYLRAVGGYSATLVFYEPPQSTSFGVLKPCAGGGLGVGLDIGDRFSIQAGARFLAVFYDVNAFLSVVPEICIEIR
jgi:hypothetical protein